MRILLLVDYRGYFYSSTRYRDPSMDAPRIASYLEKAGFSVIIRPFADVDFRNEDYRDVVVLYQSSEDRELLYKGYIEDILLGLQLKGARLVPDFPYFRAHHDKVFMEILRDISHNPSIMNVWGKGFGTYEEFRARVDSLPKTVVMKPSAGAASRGVARVENRTGQLRHARRISCSGRWWEHIRKAVEPYLRGPTFVKSIYRNKFVVGGFIPDLQNDFKILIYGDRYYVLYRRNRRRDFRASGSGMFEFHENIPEGLLDYAEDVFHTFKCPFLSMDVGFDGKKYYVFEFQCVMFGNLTLEKSEFYFQRKEGAWTIVKEKSELERVFAESVMLFLRG
jgi:glutathione synthase/RimK-type ligase-like ATP-grasp enzyme